MYSISFQAQTQSATQKQNNKTHAGLVAGSILGGTQLINGIVNKNKLDKSPELIAGTDEFKKELQSLERLGLDEKEALQSIEKIKGAMKNYKKFFIPITVGTAALSVACGAIVDNVRNKKAAAANNAIIEKGIENALEEGHNVRLTKEGNPYYKSNDGARLGALLGAGVGLASTCATFATKAFDSVIDISKLACEKKGISHKNIKAKSIAGTALIVVPLFALGGLLMGKLSDYYNNKAAIKASNLNE